MLRDPSPPTRDLVRIHRFTYWTVLATGPLVLFTGMLFLVGDAAADGYGPAAIVSAVLLLAAGVLGTAALWVFLERTGSRTMRRLLAAGWVTVAAGLAIGAVERDISGAWVSSAVILEAARLLQYGRGRHLRSSLLSSGVIILASIAIAAAGLADGSMVVFSLLFTPSVLGGVIGQWWFYEIAERLDDARAVAGELAVAEERLRFASELHDIQGGHLQAIALKAQLARRLVEREPARAEAELEQVEALARQALDDTREVVSGYRKVSLADEIDSAGRVLRSAGIQTIVRADAPRLRAGAERLLGLLVREATTNMLRHSRARAAELAVAADGTAVTATVANDGAAEAEHPSGNGIAMLAERFAEAGGTVTAALEGRRFTLTGTLPLDIEEQP
ncbi:hypothetical protein GCM10027447_35380 [Glycomyces halotolerans]